MSRYIEFTTAAGQYTDFSRGNPVHDGKLPTQFIEVKGIRIDGQLATFANDDLVDNLHRTLVEGQALEAKSRPFNCVTFAALMGGIMLTEGNPLRGCDQRQSVDSRDASVSVPLNIGVGFGGEFYTYRHTVSPAHQPEQAQYIHKLGDEGPICLSGLRDAMWMYDCTVAHPVIITKL